MAWYVSKSNLLGANVGAMVAVPLARATIEAPAFALDDKVDTSLSESPASPARPGLAHQARLFAAGLQIYAPTGRYECGGDDNIGKGMWTYEPFLGTTPSSDEKRTVSLAATAYWELHRRQEGHEYRKSAQSLYPNPGRGSASRSSAGAILIGGAYYAQWKLTEDQLAEFELPGGSDFDVDFPGKHRVFAFGPDIAYCRNRHQVEALRLGQRPLSMGVRRPAEDAGRHAGGDRDLPDSERKTAMARAAATMEPRQVCAECPQADLALRVPASRILLDALDHTEETDMSSRDTCIDRSSHPRPAVRRVDHLRCQGSRHRSSRRSRRLRPPKGAPNVLIVLLDDVGFGATERLRRPDPHTDGGQPGRGRPEVQPLPHHGAVLADPPGAADRPQPPLGEHGRHHRDRDRRRPATARCCRTTMAPLAMTLKLNGYSTAQFGKCHEVPVWETSPARAVRCRGRPAVAASSTSTGSSAARPTSGTRRSTKAPPPVEPEKTPEAGLPPHGGHDRQGDRAGSRQQKSADARQAVLHVLRAGRDCHAPHHVPKEWADKYKGKFDQGWDELRERRFLPLYR